MAATCQEHRSGILMGAGKRSTTRKRLIMSLEAVPDPADACPEGASRSYL